MSGWRVYLGVARGRFLLLAFCCVVLGIALSLPLRGMSVAFALEALLVLLAGVAANASVNALNEYCDFHSGLDLQTQRTPFSGGSGTLPACPQQAPVALWGGLAGLLLCVLIGALFLGLRPQAALPLAILGLAGVLLILLYTPWLTRHPWCCLPAPGIGFGLLMVPGCQLALAGETSEAGWLCGLSVFFFCNNLLLLNQLPDVSADRQAGRLTVPMVLGLTGVRRLLLLQWLLAMLVVLAGILAGWLPQACALLWLALPLALLLWWRLPGVEVGQPASFALMGLNVLLTLLAPLLLAVGLLIAWISG